MIEGEVIQEGKKRRYRVQPTVKQIKALHYINQGMSAHQAMLKAGYAPSVASKPGDNFWNQPSLKLAISSIANELLEVGLTSKYWAGEIKRWSEAADKKGNPNYAIRIQAFDRWEKIMDRFVNNVEGKKEKVTKRVTLEEFIEN